MSRRLKSALRVMNCALALLQEKCGLVAKRVRTTDSELQRFGVECAVLKVEILHSALQYEDELRFIETAFPGLRDADAATLYHGEILFYQYARLLYALALQEWASRPSSTVGTARARSVVLLTWPPPRCRWRPRARRCGPEFAVTRSCFPTARRCSS